LHVCRASLRIADPARAISIYVCVKFDRFWLKACEICLCCLAARSSLRRAHPFPAKDRGQENALTRR
jgi:hypothetical protein